MNYKTYINKLIEDCKTALQAEPKQIITADNVDDFEGIINAVYVIEEIKGDVDETFKLFCKYKAKRCRKCPRANQASQILYVGSSVGNLKTRLKQHIGLGNNVSTYALNLERWFKGKYLITAIPYDVSEAVLQIIENSKHYELKPAFGKKGGNR